MTTTLFAVLALSGLAACGRGNLDAATSQLARDVDLATIDTVAAWNDRPAGATSDSRTLNTGARIDATWGRSITSQMNKAGETVTVFVTSDARDDRGRIVIPRGATIDIVITELEPATTSKDAHGTFVLNVKSTTIRGRKYLLAGTVTVPHSLKMRGIGKAPVLAAAPAAESARRDVVVSVGSRVLITLKGPFTIGI